jgi:hypothetical protein
MNLYEEEDFIIAVEEYNFAKEPTLDTEVELLIICDGDVTTVAMPIQNLVNLRDSIDAYLDQCGLIYDARMPIAQRIE